MTLDLGTLHIGEQVRLLRDISGYEAGTVGKVVESLIVKETNGSTVPAVLVEWPIPTDRFGPGAKPTRDEFTQLEQDSHGFLDRI